MRGFECSAASQAALTLSRGGGLDEALLRDKLGGLGGTPFSLARMDCAGLGTGLHLPVSELKALRRQLVAELSAAVERGPAAHRGEGPRGGAVRTALLARVPTVPAEQAPRLLPMCRTDAQLEAVIAAGCPRWSWTGWSWWACSARWSGPVPPAARHHRHRACAEARRGGL
jgi:putative protease